MLRYFLDMPDSQIAEELNCRPGTVRGYVSRALATLRIELDRAEPPAGSVDGTTDCAVPDSACTTTTGPAGDTRSSIFHTTAADRRYREDFR